MIPAVGAEVRKFEMIGTVVMFEFFLVLSGLMVSVLVTLSLLWGLLLLPFPIVAWVLKLTLGALLVLPLLILGLLATLFLAFWRWRRFQW